MLDGPTRFRPGGRLGPHRIDAFIAPGVMGAPTPLHDWSRGDGSARNRLETVDAELATLVEFHAFGGLTIEAGHVLSKSPAATRDWRTAKARLNRELGSDGRP